MGDAARAIHADESMDLLMEDALKIAAEREQILDYLRDELLKENCRMETVRHLAARLCGLTEINGKMVV